MKKTTALLLTLSVLTALISGAFAAVPAFPDILDSSTAQDAAVLQMLGVIEGSSGGNFLPDNALTRAEFCKMAIVIQGRAAEEVQNRSRTIFPDVRSDHWARGYINTAASPRGDGTERIIAGNSDGTFKPDDKITYAQAITILLRMLGYDESVIGMLWPSDHIRFAANLGLTDGMTVNSAEPILRSEAAKLFVNLLFTNKKADGEPFYTTIGTAIEDVIILDLNAEALDGSSGAIRAIGLEDTIKAKSGIVPEIFLGMRGTLITNAGQAITFIPEFTRSESFLASSADTFFIKSTGGVQYNFPPETTIYLPDGKSALLKDIFADIAGNRITLYYKNDKIDAVYMAQTIPDTAMIVVSDSVSPAAFITLTDGDTDYTIIRNGLESSFSEIRKYDVATYNKASKVLTVSDFRVTAYYENVRPNRSRPSEVYFLNSDKPFEVLPSAADGLSKYKPGAVLTFLLTADNKIAGVYEPAELFAAPIGIASDVTTESVTVTLLNGMVFTGNTKLNDYQAGQLNGALVTLSADEKGSFVVTQVGASGEYSHSIDLNEMTAGTKTISPDVKIFDKVGNSGVTQISQSELMQGKIPPEKILYLQTDSIGQIELIVLNDLTGDLYEYGFLTLEFYDIFFAGSTIEQRGVTLRSSKYPNEGDMSPLPTGVDFPNGDAGGLVASADGSDLASLIVLTRVNNIRRSAFRVIGERMYISVKGIYYPVADNVQCYNKTTGLWFESLAEARAYSDSLTVYYDRPVSENGKIRLVVAE